VYDTLAFCYIPLCRCARLCCSCATLQIHEEFSWLFSSNYIDSHTQDGPRSDEYVASSVIRTLSTLRKWLKRYNVRAEALFPFPAHVAPTLTHVKMIPCPSHTDREHHAHSPIQIHLGECMMIAFTTSGYCSLSQRIDESEL
jgi:hypothetical protein